MGGTRGKTLTCRCRRRGTRPAAAAAAATALVLCHCRLHSLGLGDGVAVVQHAVVEAAHLVQRHHVRRAARLHLLRVVLALGRHLVVLVGELRLLGEAADDERLDGALVAAHVLAVGINRFELVRQPAPARVARVLGRHGQNELLGHRDGHFFGAPLINLPVLNLHDNFHVLSKHAVDVLCADGGGWGEGEVGKHVAKKTEGERGIDALVVPRPAPHKKHAPEPSPPPPLLPSMPPSIGVLRGSVNARVSFRRSESVASQLRRKFL